jgi:hypothetical protein
MANLGINLGVVIGSVGGPLGYPLINGVSYSWASIEFKFAGAVVTEVLSVDYKITRERKKTYGTNVNPLRKTRGKIDYSAKWKMCLPAFYNLLQGLGAQDPSGNFAYGDVFWEADITYTENGFNPILVIIRGNTMDSVENSHAEGVEEPVVEFETNPLMILLDSGAGPQPMSSIPLSAPQF